MNRQRVLEKIPGGSFGVSGVAFSPDGKLLAAAAFGDNNISLWDATTHLKTNQITAESPFDVAFSPDSRFVAASGVFEGDHSNAVLLQNIATHEVTFLTDTLGSLNVAYSSDGAYVVANNPASGAVIVWDAVTHKIIGKLNDKNGYPIHSIALSENGKTLASTACTEVLLKHGCVQSVITLWDMTQYKPWGSLPTASAAGATTLSLSPDGHTLASGGSNNAVVLWNVVPTYWQALACHIVNRNLSQDEWNQYLGADLPYEQTCPDQRSADASALWPQYSTDQLAAGSSISMTAQPSLATTAEPPLAVASVITPHIPQTVVTGMPNGLSLAFPALIQCRASGDSSNLVQDYFGIWAIRVDNNDQWIPQGKAEAVFSSTTTTDVQKYNISFTLAPNELGWLISEDAAAGKVMKDIPSSGSVLRLAMQDVVWKSASSQIGQYRYEVGFMNHSMYGNSSYPQHATMFSVRNLGKLEMKKVRLFGVLQNHLGDAVDVLFREGAADLPPGEAGYFLIKSRSSSGRCVGAADSQGYILHYWLDFETEDGQSVTRYYTTKIQ